MDFSERYAEVIALVVRGLSNQEIAVQLGITEKTVKFHLSEIYKRAGVTSRAKLIVKFMTEAVTAEERQAMREILAGNG